MHSCIRPAISTRVWSIMRGWQTQMGGGRNGGVADLLALHTYVMSTGIPLSDQCQDFLNGGMADSNGGGVANTSSDSLPPAPMEQYQSLVHSICTPI